MAIGRCPSGLLFLGLKPGEEVCPEDVLDRTLFFRALLCPRDRSAPFGVPRSTCGRAPEVEVPVGFTTLFEVEAEVEVPAACAAISALCFFLRFCSAPEMRFRALVLGGRESFDSPSPAFVVVCC